MLPRQAEVALAVDQACGVVEVGDVQAQGLLAANHAVAVAHIGRRQREVAITDQLAALAVIQRAGAEGLAGTGREPAFVAVVQCARRCIQRGRSADQALITVVQGASDLEVQSATAGNRATGLVVKAARRHLQEVLGGYHAFDAVIQRLGDAHLQAVATDDFAATVVQRVGHHRK